MVAAGPDHRIDLHLSSTNKMKIALIVLVVCLSCRIVVSADDDPKTSDYWLNSQKAALKNSRTILERTTVEKAKNIIMFLGDGMGLPTVAAARLLKQQNKNGSKSNLVFEDFDYAALIRTYNLDHPVPDSAGTGTAFMTGVKTNMAVIGVNGNVPPGSNDCDLITKNTVKTVLEMAHEKKLSTGIVTTASVTDATPAACYAHVSSRYFESSLGSASNNQSKCKDIARQLVEDHAYINVVLGGGKKNFLPNDTEDGVRTDGLDLFDVWKNAHKDLDDSQYALVHTRNDMRKVDPTKVDHLFGTFSKNHMKYDKERVKDDEEPSLAEMTKMAIDILKKNKDGFFLMVEGAKIDKAHHDNQASYSLHDVLAFEKAIEMAKGMLENDTLIIVTADHSHAFTMNGGSKTEDDILGFANFNDGNKMPFTMLLYSNGPGFRNRKIETLEEIKKDDYRQYSAVPLNSATHGGDDVAAYATGPGSNLLRGCQDQTYLGHLMAYSACLGQYEHEKHCNSGSHLTPFVGLMAIVAISHWFRNSMFSMFFCC